jgi:hypothetical protein
MAFAFETTARAVSQGNYKKAFGTFTNGGGDTGGDITVSGARQIVHVNLQHTGAAVASNAPSVNATLPLTSATFTIVTDDGADGLWEAIYR